MFKEKHNPFMPHQNHQGARHSLTGGNTSPFTLPRRLAGAAALVAWLAAALGATATEVLLNRSFDTNGANWELASQAVSNTVFGTIGEAYPTAAGGYTGTILWQNLDVPNAGGATGTASMTLNKMSSPPFGVSVTIYLEYTVAGGATNRMLLLNPDNSVVLSKPDSSLFTTNFTVPAEAQSIVRLAVDKTYFGQLYIQDLSLDVVTSGGPPELGLSIVDPTEGVTNTAPFLLRAGVTNLTATVSSLQFYANGALVGEGCLDPHGEWLFADGSRLSAMGGGGYEMVDITDPATGYMFFMNGAYTSQTNYDGGFQYFPSGGGMSGGAVSILFSLDAAGLLTAAITGAAPLGVRTLSNGTNQNDTINYGFFWANAPAGNYAITARAVYNSGLMVTSPPVNITVIGAIPVVHPVLTLIPVASGYLGFQWDATLGQTYRVLSTTNLANPDWQPVGDSITATNTTTSISYPAGGEIQRFYRVVTP